jgi:heme-degrading monooxygenase HmoA
MMKIQLALTVLLPCLSHIFAFTSTGLVASHKDCPMKLCMSAVEIDEDKVTPTGLLKRDRYVATNRFAVRSNKGPKFEARWANRKSRLASLPGFRYFHLMRRVKLNEDGTNEYDEGDSSDGSNMGNYVSFTIWEKKSDFSAWRKGDAFKEAHGGTSISAFMSTMISSALILKGPPRPAFYDGILHQSLPPSDVPETVDGWRNVVADGKTNLPTECFVACNQFFVPKENAAAFEDRWASRESKLKECEGFVSFTMCRRDASSKGHGVKPMEPSEPTYVSTTVWKDRASFEKWRKGNAFKQAHGQGQNNPNAQSSSEKGTSQPPQWSKPPEPVFYEGTLVISKPEGA